MTSTPPAITTSLNPARICMAASRTAWSPEPQRRSIWVPVTVVGSPASRAATRPMAGASPEG